MFVPLPCLVIAADHLLQLVSGQPDALGHTRREGFPQQSFGQPIAVGPPAFADVVDLVHYRKQADRL